MKIRPTLLSLARVIADECEKNAPFRIAVEQVLGGNGTNKTKTPEKRISKAKSHRRSPAVLDPVSMSKEGEAALRNNLSLLDIEQLKDIVAQYGMDPSKLVMKWKEPARIIDRIVESSLQRAAKGDAFRF